MVVGLFVAGVAFFFYQSQKVIPKDKTDTISIKAPTPSPKADAFLTIDSPANEDVVDSKTVVVKGKTSPDATVIATSDVDSEMVSPAQNGDFSITLTIGSGENVLEVTTILPNGDMQTLRRSLTYSTESF